MRKTIAILTVVLLLAGCGRKWKLTAPVTMELDLIKSRASVEYFWIEQGNLHFERFSLEGDRKQSRDIGFEDVFEKTNTLNVRSELLTSPLQYDIQQGTYTDFDARLRLDIEDGNYDNSVELIGTYKRFDGTFLPVRFEFDQRIDLNFEKVFPDEAEEFSILAEQDYVAVLTVDLMDWFATLGQEELEQATLSDIPGLGEGILITRDVNSDLFDEIISRVGESEKLIFQ